MSTAISSLQKLQRWVVSTTSSILAGAPVAAAGEIEVRNGRLAVLSDRSGHYLPAREFTEQFINELRERGIDTDQVEKELEGR